jgi:hypothetical protein
MLLRSHERLPLIKPALEWTLTITQVLVIPCLIVIAEISIFTSLFGPKAVIQRNWVLTIIILIVLPLHLALNRLPKIKTASDSLILKLKRVVVLSCPWVSAPQTQANWRAACWFILREFRQPLFRYDSQRVVVDDIVRQLNAEQLGGARFVYIEGDSGQGKTRTIFLLIHALLRHRKLFDIADRAFLYDMALGCRTQSALEMRLNSIEHDNALIFVDNFHRVEPQILRNITLRLLDTPGPNVERLIILLGQPSHAWRIRPTAEVRIVSIARSNGAFFRLKGVRGTSLSDELAGLPGIAIWKQVFGSADSQPASVAQLQFAQAIIRSKGKELVLINELIQLIETTPTQDEPQYAELIHVLALMTALSLYRGWFTWGQFSRACWENSVDRQWGSRVVYCARILILLHRMSHLGFVTRVTAPNRQFVFHEAMAEHCKDRLAENPTFWTHFSAAVRTRLQGYEEPPSVNRWLLSTELHEAHSMERLFDRALLTGTLSPMVRCLDRNWKYLQESSAIRYQYAMLLDQVGRFPESRRLFGELKPQVAKESVLAGRVQLARVEVEHTPESYTILGEISLQSDSANKIAAEYWRIHLNAHRGIFQPDELANLAENMGIVFQRKDFEQSYFLLHQAARIYFDAHRHIYLCGESVEKKLDRLRQLPIENVLRQHLPQFRAFWILYREAHLLAHHLLPNLEFFGNAPDPNGVLGSSNGALTSRTLIRMAHEAYSRARDEFALYGDREYLYLDADILNVEMLSAAVSENLELEGLRSKLIDYEAFIQKTAFDDILSYPAFYSFRWYMLRFFTWIQRGNLEADDEADQNFRLAFQSLEVARDLDRACGNAYGLWRTDFFMGLLNGIRNKSAQVLADSLMASKADAEKNGYLRDSHIIQSLLDKPKITPLNIRQVVLFFPFVHQ